MSQSYSTNNITILGRDNLGGNANTTYIRNPGEDTGEIEVKGFNNCPFCMKTDELAITWEQYMTTTPGGIEYVFDLTLLCRGCGVMMDENGLNMADALSSLQDRWNRRPSRDDFSRELFKARMYDKQEAWMKEELARWGPFTIEQMEQYFDKSIFELIAVLTSTKDTVEIQNGELRQSASYIQRLHEQIDALNRGDAETAKKLERMFTYGAGSIGSAYFNGRTFPAVSGRSVNQNGGNIQWSQDGMAWDHINWDQIGHETIDADAYDKYIDEMRKLGRSIGQHMGQAIDQMASGFNSFAPSVVDMIEKMKESLPPEVLQELQEYKERESRRAEREESKNKALLRSQRNKQHLIEDKKRKR